MLTNYQMGKLSKQTTNIEKTAKKKAKKISRSWRVKLALIIAGSLLGIVMADRAITKTADWFSKNKIVRQKILTIKFPYKIVPLVTKVEGVKISSPIPVDTAKIEREKLIERIYQYVRYLESEIGFNDNPDSTHAYCQSIGKVNEIGYFMNGDKHFCFSSEAKQREGFMFEYEDRMKKGYTIKEFLCEWVTGTRQPQCKRTLDMGL